MFVCCWLSSWAAAVHVINYYVDLHENLQVKLQVEARIMVELSRASCNSCRPSTKWHG